MSASGIWLSKGYAQEVNDYSQMAPQDLQKFSLPPLSLLFENAKNSPSYEFQNVAIQIQQSLLNKQKKDFLSFFSLRGSYQYGKFSNDGYYSDVYTPAVSTFSSQSQNLYSLGAGINIPLDKLFDIGPSIKRQRLSIRSAELEREMKYEEIKKEIIILYADISLQMNTLKINSEALTLADAQYEIAEKNFANGKTSPGDLSIDKNRQSDTKKDYETCKSELIKNLMMLELISHTSFLKK
jgi:outer membrane protein TolC